MVSGSRRSSSWCRHLGVLCVALLVPVGALAQAPEAAVVSASIGGLAPLPVELDPQGRRGGAPPGDSPGPVPAGVPGAVVPDIDARSLPVDGATYAVRLRRMGMGVDEVKERVRRSHSRVSLLSDSLLRAGTAQASILLLNRLSQVFKVTRALFVLDGAVEGDYRDGAGVLDDNATLKIFIGTLPPGEHTLQILVELDGRGTGVFSYHPQHRQVLRSSHRFTLDKAGALRLRAVVWERQSASVPVEYRPKIRYELEDPKALEIVRVALQPRPAGRSELPQLSRRAPLEAPSLRPVTEVQPPRPLPPVPQRTDAQRQAQRRETRKFSRFAVKSLTSRQHPEGFKVKDVPPLAAEPSPKEEKE